MIECNNLNNQLKTILCKRHFEQFYPKTESVLSDDWPCGKDKITWEMRHSLDYDRILYLLKKNGFPTKQIKKLKNEKQTT